MAILNIKILSELQLFLKIFMSKNYLKFAFKYFDVENTGVITFEEIKKRFLQNSNNKNEAVERQLKNIYDSIDINHDGTVSFDEFCKMMKSILRN
jgi:Ca2+-binding EF-hand superfamily protein